jgi:hypothetical protein
LTYQQKLWIPEDSFNCVKKITANLQLYCTKKCFKNEGGIKNVFRQTKRCFSSRKKIILDRNIEMQGRIKEHWKGDL